MENKLKPKWILCIIIFFLVLLIYGNHLLKERAKKLEDMRRTEAFDFMDDGWKKYRMMQYAGANMEYTDSKGNIKVIETEPGVKGNTATNVTKLATVETGATVQVPIFIDVDEVIQIDTRTGEYLGRAK